MLAPNTILQNRYRIVRELGHGGMGTVYEAIDQRVNCLVALKETHASREGEGRRAFEREAALLANLRHQALPKVMDYFSENESDFLVMEFIPGYDLADMLDLRGSPFPQPQVLRWANDLLRVLEYLHSQEPPILHRDIKPANLKLTRQGEIFLLDFGLAKGSIGQMPTYKTGRSMRGYTPGYAPVEQIMGHGTDARSDLYSLGATLYHLLAGGAPVNAPARFHAVEEEQPDPLQSIQHLNPQATANVSGVILQAMAISRKERPISAAEMRKALRNAAEEDERNSAEEEYARAETRRREREEQRRRAEEEAAARSEGDRLLQEAETRKKSEEARLAAERAQQELEHRREAEAQKLEAEAKDARRREQEEARRREREEAQRREQEEARRRVQPSATVPAVTVLPPPRAADTSQTIPAPPPERFTTDQLSGRATVHPELKPKSTLGARRTMIVAAAIVVLLLGAVVATILWSKRGTRIQTSSSADAPLQVGLGSPSRQPAQASENKPVLDLLPLGLPISSPDDLLQVTLSPDGQLLASTGGNTVRLWRITSPGKSIELHDREGTEDEWRAVAFSPDGKMLVSGNDKGSLQIWNLSDNSPINRLKILEVSHIFRVSFSTDGQTLLSAAGLYRGEPKKVNLWRVSDLKMLADMTVEAQKTIIAVNPDRRVVAIKDPKNGLQMWSIENQSFLKQFQGYGEKVLNGTFSADGETLVLSNSDGTVQLINVSDGRLIKTLAGPKGEVYRVAISPDAKVVAGGWSDGTVQLWRVDDGAVIKSMVAKRVRSLAFSANSQVFASASEDKTIRLWRVSEKKGEQ